MCWWPRMHDDVTHWVDTCLTCLRFRRMATKQEQTPVVPNDAEPWEEVMVDLEGPNNPPDKDGNRYVMTYICCLCSCILPLLAAPLSALTGCLAIVGLEPKWLTCTLGIHLW